MSFGFDIINSLVLDDDRRKKLLKNLNGFVEKNTELSNNVDDWPEDWRDNYEERAAIMEYDGGLKRNEAEAQAEQRIRIVYEQVYKNGQTEGK